jgi:hypothetical protein
MILLTSVAKKSVNRVLASTPDGHVERRLVRNDLITIVVWVTRLNVGITASPQDSLDQLAHALLGGDVQHGFTLRPTKTRLSSVL